MSMNKLRVYAAALAVLLLVVVTTTSGVWLTGGFAHGAPAQSSTTTSTAGSITFTSPSSGSSFTGAQTVIISGTVSPTPSLPDSVFIDMTLLGSASPVVTTTQAVAASGAFSYTARVGGSPLWVTGTYVITATDSSAATGTITFQYVVPAATNTTTTTTSTSTSTSSATSTSSTSTATEIPGAITFTSPSSGTWFMNPQNYTISGTISPTPSLPDHVSIEVALLGSSLAIVASTQAVAASGAFSYATHAGGASWVTGTYVVVATDSNGATGFTTFEYTAPSATTTTSTTSSASTTTTKSTTSTTTSSTTATTSFVSTIMVSTGVTQTMTTTFPVTITATSTSTQSIVGPTVTVAGPTSTLTSTSTAPSSTITHTQTTTQTATTTLVQTTSIIPDWAYGVMAILLILGLAVGYVVKRPPTRPG